MVAVPRLARSWAVRWPPNSRASRPAMMIVPAAARAAHSRRPTTDTPNRDKEIRASKGVKIGWST